jgi:hypothetical protein
MEPEVFHILYANQKMAGAQAVGPPHKKTDFVTS